ncbi:MAG: endonuclease domain-containing protein [Nevskia sp.]|nr:endonuclease domain-containing protein [Nevskia sp.]
MKPAQPPDTPRPLAGEGQGRGAVKARSQRLAFAKELRKQPTDAELCLWYHLRAHRFLGLKFTRQRPIGPYIVDFVCYERSLIIEVDGGQHNDQTLETDSIRDEWLKAKGFRVLRFWNNDVLTNTESVLESIRLAADLHGPSPPTPLPQAGEGSSEGAA